MTVVRTGFQTTETTNERRHHLNKHLRRATIAEGVSMKKSHPL